MDDKHISTGLALLADDMAPLEVDIDEVIAAARLRNRRRQAVTASALGTVGVIAVLTVAVTMVGVGDNRPGPPPPQPPATTSGAQSIPGRAANAVIDDRARRLTHQLAQAKTRIIPTDMRIESDPKNAEHIIGGPPSPLEFILQDFADLPGPINEYTAFAKLSDELGWGTLRISVGHADQRPDIEGQMTCAPGSKSCVTREFPDRTRATLHYNIGTATGWNQGMTALRPDGTYIMVACDVFFFDSSIVDAPPPPSSAPPQSPPPKPTRPQIPLSTDQLFDLATVFTY